jgi:hypothetical protein
MVLWDDAVKACTASKEADNANQIWNVDIFMVNGLL